MRCSIPWVERFRRCLLGTHPSDCTLVYSHGPMRQAASLTDTHPTPNATDGPDPGQAKHSLHPACQALIILDIPGLCRNYSVVRLILGESCLTFTHSTVHSLLFWTTYFCQMLAVNWKCVKVTDKNQLLHTGMLHYRQFDCREAKTQYAIKQLHLNYPPESTATYKCR